MQGTRVLRNYILERPLGHGGFGNVWVARHDLTGERVAAKVLERSRQGNTLELLRREALVLHRLDRSWRDRRPAGDPPFVRFIDIDETSDFTVILMELLSGTDLRAAINRRPGPWPSAAVGPLMAALLDSLVFIHNHDVMHRDIKPGNIFLMHLGPNERVQLRLLDMGIARWEADAPNPQTRVMGSMHYMAPERFRGESSPLIDLYAAGLVGWELLAGRPACPEREPLLAMRWHEMVGAPPIQSVREAVPDALAQVIDTLVARDPSQRFPSAELALSRLHPWHTPASEGFRTDYPQDLLSTRTIDDAEEDPGAQANHTIHTDPPTASTRDIPPADRAVLPRGAVPSISTIAPDPASSPPSNGGTPPAPTAPVPDMRTVQLLLAGIFVVLLLGCGGMFGITALSYGYATWLTRGAKSHASDEVDKNMMKSNRILVEKMAEGIAPWARAHKRPPRDLRELGDHAFVDVWQHPLQYRTEGNRWWVMSLGKDGRPGGSGVAADYESGSEL